MMEYLYPYLLLGVYLGMFSTVIMRLVIDKKRENKQKKHQEDIRERIKNGTYKSSPMYFPG